MTVPPAPVPASTIPGLLVLGPPLPPPVSSSVPELPSIVPRSFTRNPTEAVPELAVHSRIPPALLLKVPSPL